MIRIGRENSGNRAHLDAALIKANVQLDWFYEVNNLTTSLGLVEEGLGAVVLPRLAAPHGHHSLIVTKPLRGPEVTRTIGIIERPQVVCRQQQSVSGTSYWKTRRVLLRS